MNYRVSQGGGSGAPREEEIADPTTLGSVVEQKLEME